MKGILPLISSLLSRVVVNVVCIWLHTKHCILRRNLSVERIWIEDVVHLAGNSITICFSTSGCHRIVINGICVLRGTARSVILTCMPPLSSVRIRCYGRRSDVIEHSLSFRWHQVTLEHKFELIQLLNAHELFKGLTVHSVHSFVELDKPGVGNLDLSINHFDENELQLLTSQ